MKQILLIVLALIASLSFGQTEKENNNAVTDLFIENYNSANYEEMFTMFTDAMKNYLPLEKTKEFIKGFQAQEGNITSKEFVKYEGTSASYKIVFENAVKVLNISIDANSKITGFFIQEDISEKAVNALSIADNVITQKQSEIIFDNANPFPNSTQISIAIIKNEKVHYYGIHKEKDTISSMDNHKSIFEIGSITKVFTSTLLANLVIAGKVKLNENINDYLKTPIHNSAKFSFVDLANHTSGLPRMPTNIDVINNNPENPYKEYKEKELKAYLTNQLVLSNKGTHQYSNLGAGLLGYTLGKIEKDTYENLLQKKIFSKYNMLNSTVDLNKAKRNLVKGLNSEGKEVSNWEFSALAGAGAIFSTVEDLSHFAVAQFEYANKELRLTREKTFEVHNTMDIGLGWHILKSPSDNLWYWYAGGTAGYSSSMVIDENSKNGIVILSNVSAFNPHMGNIDKLCFALMKTLEQE